MAQDAHPTAGDRIRAAMNLAGGIDFPELARRIDTPGYAESTLRNIANDNFLDRPARPGDLAHIGRACGVGPGFWEADFSEMDGESLRQDVKNLRVDVVTLTADVLNLWRELQAHRAEGHRGESSEGGAQ